MTQGTCPWAPGPATTIAYTLDAIDGGTRVTLRHSGFTNAQACDNHADRLIH